jgi:hypothetical protein
MRSFTDIFQILFANFERRRDLLNILDRLMRETGWRDNPIITIQGFIPERASRNVTWSFVLELSTESIPKTSVVCLVLCVYAEDADCLILWMIGCGILREMQKMITLSFILRTLVRINPMALTKNPPRHQGYNQYDTRKWSVYVVREPGDGDPQ